MGRKQPANTTWNYSKLGAWVNDEKIEIGRGDIISKDDINMYPGPYPIYSSSAHNNGKFGEYAKCMFDEELITWSVDGGGNLFYRPRHKFSVTNVCGYLRVKSDQLHAPFIYYSLSEQHRYLTFDYMTKAHPSVIRNLYQLPSIRLETQQKIARILQTIDQAIEKTEALIDKYQQIKAGLMHDLFTRGIGADGKLRPPREEAPELYQETPIGWIPKEWSSKTLGSACDWFSGGTPSKQNEEWWNGSLPWLSPKDMKHFEVFDTENHVTKEAALSSSRIVPENTVFIVVRGMILAHSFPVVISGREFSFNQDVKAVIAQPPLYNRYLAYWFVANKNLFLKKTTESTHGTKRFDLKDIYQLEIGVPLEEEQQRIIARMDVIDNRINSEFSCWNKLQKQKFGLMHDLLTGKVPVKADTEAQPEAVRA